MNTFVRCVVAALPYKRHICIHTHTTIFRGCDLIRAIALSFPCGGLDTTLDT
jgi:hypothetical protein